MGKRFFIGVALSWVVVGLPAAVVQAAPQEPVISVAEALKILRNDAYKRDRALQQKVQAALRAKRTPQEKQEAVKLLLPTLGHFKEYGWGRGMALSRMIARVGEPMIPGLIEALKDDAKWRDAALCLPMIARAAGPALAALLEDPKPEVRVRALKLFGDPRVAFWGGNAAVSNLIALASRAKGDAQVEAARALVTYVQRRAQRGKARVLEGVNPLLQQIRTSKSITARILLVRVVGDLGPDAAAHGEVLLPLLDDTSTSLRGEAIEALGKIGFDKAVPRLEKIVSDPAEDLYIRRAAVYAMAGMGRVGRVALVKQLGEGDDDAAYHAALALTGKQLLADRAVSEETVRLLADALRGRNARTTRFALFALAKIGPPARPVAGTIAELLRSRDPAVRTNALEALSRITPEEALPVITPLLRDADPVVARAAASAISNIVKDEARLADLLAEYRKRTAWKERPADPTLRPFTKAELAKYEVGGPLAGVKLPLFPTQHGEPAGHPGCLPDPDNPGRLLYDKQGLSPERHLHPHSVEHWRAYWFKYCPVRSFYDQQSLLKNWGAPRIPGADAAHLTTYASPVYQVPRHALPRDTGKRLPPVPVVKCGVRSPVFRLDLGELAPGLYTVRVIAAVSEKAPRKFLEPLYFAMKVNDGLDDRSHTYRIRSGYVDEFYGIAEISFHAPVARRYRAEIYVADGSRVEPLIHNIELHDALAGTIRKAIKRRPTTAEPPAKVNYRTRYLTEERLARDADIWRAMPPLNKQIGHYAAFQSLQHFQSPGDSVRFGQDGMTRSEIQDKYGKWYRGKFPVFLENRKLCLKYTYAEFEAGKPLPDPYPFKDDGAGLYQADPDDPKKGQAFIPIAEHVGAIVRDYGSIDRRKNCGQWLKNGDIDAARDEAVRLLRIAYRCPAIESSHCLHNVTTNPGVYGRDSACRRRQTQPQGTWLSFYGNFRTPPLYYDKLFTYIAGNQELARSIGRFLPEVKQPDDLVRLLDVYLVQTVAKRILRYHYYTSNSALAIADVALALGDRVVTAPWIKWLFSRTFIYPLPLEGIQNLGVTSSGRSGCSYIGSSFYAGGEGAASRARNVEKYLKEGLFPPKYDLRRPDLYPKTQAHLNWHLEIVVGGHEALRIGDVNGAERTAYTTFAALPGFAPYGWKWFQDPRWAWIIRHVRGRTNETDAEWREIERAAATVKRAPWLDNRSRQVYNWAGILESGLEFDDYRFRNAVYVRTGLGIGHAHSDGLDLQIVSHGLPMTVDGGQRPGYSTPADAAGRVHNVVTVDGGGNYIQAWVRTLNDAPGAKYMRVAGAHNTASLYRRQVALIDVDRGKGARNLSVDEQKFGAKLPTQGIVPPNSYVFDVFRVAGGNTHTYCFHGPVSDQVISNEKNKKDVGAPADPKRATPEQAFLRSFRRSSYRTAGDAADDTEVTWRYTRAGVGAEALHGNFDPASPRKYLRLFLFGTRGMRVLRAQGVCHARNYKLDHVFVQRRPAAEGGATVYAALIEPYAGKPFIVSKRQLAVADNETDARRAVAVEVKTANGHTDVLFADGRPNKTRKFAGLTASGEFACYSTDAQGLRLANLHGGALLQGPELEIRAAAPLYTGKVLSVDYLKRRMVIDASWPTGLAGEVMEIVTPRRRTCYTLKRVEPRGGQTVITVLKGADYYRSQIDQVKNGTVTCRLSCALGKRKGLSEDFTAMDVTGKKFWHADYLGGRDWKLKGGPVTLADFGEEKALTIYEYGPGDGVELKTRVSLLRKGPGLYEVRCNVPCTVRLRARDGTVSSDLKTWKSSGETAGGFWAVDLLPSASPWYVKTGR